jgi:hypothetical protein
LNQNHSDPRSPSMVPRLSCCPLTRARLSGKLAVVNEHRNATWAAVGEKQRLEASGGEAAV